LTSKAPKHLRFRLLNTDEDKGVKIRFWYAERNRKDVYADNTLVRSTNTGTDKNGKLAILRATGICYNVYIYYIKKESTPSLLNYLV
jgi:hypothetical protein